MGRNRVPPPDKLTAELLLGAYAAGYFPMADSRTGEELYWFNPEIRGVLTLKDPDAFHLPRSLRKFMRRMPYRLTYNTAFRRVIAACADSRAVSGEETWINDEIIQLYCELHERGHAFSVEVWEGTANRNNASDMRDKGRSAERRSLELASCEIQENFTEATLIGGLYGIALGGAFFGESMFSTHPNASKVALVKLVQSLQSYGFELLDAQFENEHLTQFGFVPMKQEDYLARLHHALKLSPNPSKRLLSDSLSRP